MGLMFPIYFISLVLSAGLALMSASQILDLSDLDCDYTTPSQCCAKLNRLVVPEMLCVGLLVGLNLITLNWLPFCTTSPILLWLIFAYRTNPRGYVNSFDAISIKEDKTLNKHVRKAFFKTVFYGIHFIAFMYAASLDLNIV